MQILVNKKIRQFFIMVLGSIIAFILISVVLIALPIDHAEIYIMVSALIMGMLILIAGYWYFRNQSKLMEHAITQMKEYTSGNENSRIECNDEGELYLLFHEINSLVSILNAHTEKEMKSKLFLRDTLSDISHQLKTPLAALNVYHGIIQEEAKDLSTIKDFTALSEQELDRIETLVQNLLKITKLDVERRFHYRIEQEEKRLILAGDDTVTLLCDRNWFMEAISNIVKNAIDHTEKGNTVSIEWKQFASIVQIIIKDNGCGIHPEDLYFIFKRFYRSRFSKDTQGVGLGLSLAKSIIEAHGGTIRVDSELNVGTTFVMDFLIPTKL